MLEQSNTEEKIPCKNILIIQIVTQFLAKNERKIRKKSNKKFKAKIF